MIYQITYQIGSSFRLSLQQDTIAFMPSDPTRLAGVSLIVLVSYLPTSPPCPLTLPTPFFYSSVPSPHLSSVLSPTRLMV